jgi:hypothetical protein
MAQYDLPLDELRSYRPEIEEPDNGHEGGGVMQLEKKISWLAARR